ncbi:MAG: prepilin peptidase [Candidatus Rokuibacteriota bacterium]|nr:MAG: prepilin peptidase [Candidatus Rokubacteria bacterium]
MNLPLYIVLPVIAVSAAGVCTDLLSRRVPNALTAPALLAGLAVHASLQGWSGLGAALAGMAIAGGILLPGWLAGWMGAGDVKLMAAVGAWFGLAHGTLAALLALIAGGVIAAAVAARHGVLRQSLWGAASLAAWAVSSRGRLAMPQPPTTGIRFPFALAVLAGASAAIWVRA